MSDEVHQNGGAGTPATESLDQRLKALESRRWYKSPNFWAGFAGLPVFILLGRGIDWVSGSPHVINLLHDGIGTRTAIVSDLTRPPSELADSVVGLVTSKLVNPSESHVEFIELGVVDGASLIDCIAELENSDQGTLNEPMLIETEADQESHLVQESEADCTALRHASKRVRNSVFSAMSYKRADIKLAINVSQLTFANEGEIRPIYVDVTANVEPESILRMVRFNFGYGDDVELVDAGLTRHFKVDDQAVSYRVFSASGVPLPQQTSLDPSFMRMLNARLTGDAVSSLRVSAMVMIEPSRDAS